jgi:large subunit ribosomal protein L24
MRKIKTGDTVVVISGKSKGASGKVLRVVAGGLRVIVEGVNIIKKHVKPNPNANVQGGIVEKEAPLHISNVALMNPVTQKPDRVGIKTLPNGKKARYFKSNGELVEVE